MQGNSLKKVLLFSFNEYNNSIITQIKNLLKSMALTYPSILSLTYSASIAIFSPLCFGASKEISDTTFSIIACSLLAPKFYV